MNNEEIRNPEEEVQTQTEEVTEESTETSTQEEPQVQTETVDEDNTEESVVQEEAQVQAEEVGAESAEDTETETVETPETPSEYKPEVEPGPSPESVNEANMSETFEDQDNIQPGEKPDVLTPMLRADMHENKLYAALSYIPLGFLVVFAMKGNSRYSIYHARQGVIVFFVQFIGSLFIPTPIFDFISIFIFNRIYQKRL